MTGNGGWGSSLSLIGATSVASAGTRAVDGTCASFGASALLKKLCVRARTVSAYDFHAPDAMLASTTLHRVASTSE